MGGKCKIIYTLARYPREAVDEERSTCLTNRRYDESDAKDSKGGEVFNALLRETKNEIEMKHGSFR